MNVPWKNFISPWWPSASDATVRFPVPPMPQVDELRREPWPTIVAQTSSQLPALPISSGPPQGGLLASLNGGTSGGVLGRLATPIEYLQSGRYWNGVPAPLRTSAGPIPGTGYYLLPPSRTGRRRARALPPRSCLRNRRVNRLGPPLWEIQITERGPTVVVKPEAPLKFYPMSLPTTTGFQASNMRGKGIILILGQSMESCRFQRRLGKCLIRPPQDNFRGTDGTRMIPYTAHTARLLENSWIGTSKNTISSPNR